jgi:cytochrome c oxidase cbb3-type subunit 1
VREQAEAMLYDMAVVRGFAISALVWGGVGMLVGLLAAAQLAWPELNLPPYLPSAGSDPCTPTR